MSSLLPLSRADCIPLHSPALTGFQNGWEMSSNLYGADGARDSINQDFATQIWRIKALGFNTVRLGFTFDVRLSRPPAASAAARPRCLWLGTPRPLEAAGGAPTRAAGARAHAQAHAEAARPPAGAEPQPEAGLWL